MALTVKRIGRLRQTEGRYHDRDGLYLQVNSKTSACWILRYMLRGQERMMGLGSARTFNLVEARQRARVARQQLADKIDPLEARREREAAEALKAATQITFAEATQAYFDQHDAKWRLPRHRAQFLNSLRDYAFPLLGRLPVSTIDRGLVIRVLEQNVKAQGNLPAGSFWQARTTTANRVRGRIEAVLDWATGRGYRSGDNPAAWKLLRSVLPAKRQLVKVAHYAALPYNQLPPFMARLRAQPGTAARALEFLILCAARSNEVIGAQWSEIDFDTAIWTVPAARMKAGREHKVPLSEAAVTLLRALPVEAGNPFVFLGGRNASLGPMAMAQVLKQMDVRATVHGFRSSHRDWAAEQTHFPREVCELALAHAIGDKVEAAYRRGELIDKRRQLMEAWAQFCGTTL